MNHTELSKFVNYIGIFIITATRWNNRVGRISRQLIWVFGIVDTSFQPVKDCIEIVPRRNRATLTNILNAKLAANSVIHSDEWRGYQNLPQHVRACILHNTLNHT